MMARVEIGPALPKPGEVLKQHHEGPPAGQDSEQTLALTCPFRFSCLQPGVDVGGGVADVVSPSIRTPDFHPASSLAPLLSKSHSFLSPSFILRFSHLV
jgi:hypothetical protein